MKELDEGAILIGGDLARLDLPYTEELFEYGVAEYIDVFSFHPYSARPESIIKNVSVQVRTPTWYDKLDHPVEGIKKLIAESGKGIELWQGECGYPSGANSKGWNGPGPWSPTVQSKWIVRRAMTDISYDADLSCYFLLKETSGKDGRYNYKGLLQGDTLSKKQAFNTYQRVTSFLRGKFKTMDTEFDIELKSTGSFYAMRRKNIFTTAFQNEEGQKYFAVGFQVHMQETVTPSTADLTLKQTFKDPVLVDLLTGRVLKAAYKSSGGSTTFEGLPIYDYPLVITERANL